MNTQKALFLDRDGIINLDHGYVYKIEDFEFVNGIFEVCQHAINCGYIIIVITNQAGIARGYYTIEQFEILTDWMKRQFLDQNIKITDVYFCPHHPDKGINEYAGQCSCRKPEPGMLISASEKYAISLSESVFIGDKISDIQAAESAGVKNKILLASKYADENAITAHGIDKISSAIQFIN